jgi:hypothetical protein
MTLCQSSSAENVSCVEDGCKWYINLTKQLIDCTTIFDLFEVREDNTNYFLKNLLCSPQLRKIMQFLHDRDNQWIQLVCDALRQINISFTAIFNVYLLFIQSLFISTAFLTLFFFIIFYNIKLTVTFHKNLN